MNSYRDIKINGNFKVEGIPFARWFNFYIKPYNINFPNFINEVNFAQWADNIQSLTGKEEINLYEFFGHFSICYNETGGLFKPVFEFGGAKYCFNTFMPSGHTKRSYNTAPFNRLAGDQLKEWGVISKSSDVNKWNGTIYPDDAPLAVKEIAEECDFYKFRGYGYNQLTWRSNYLKCVQSVLPESMDSYKRVEFEALLTKDLKIANKAFYNFISMNANSIFAIEKLVQGNYAHYGNLVSGGWSWYVNNKYMPRCVGLEESLRGKAIYQVKYDASETKSYAIENLGLLPYQIARMQYKIASMNREAKVLIEANGGYDGDWGNATEKAFNLLGISIQDLL